MQLFENYRWRLRELKTCESEFYINSRHIDEGIVAQDTSDPDWERHLSDETQKIREQLKKTEQLIAEIPDTPKLIRCKMFLKLHYIHGLTMTETACEMEVSTSTLRRIRRYCFHYFSELGRIRL